MLPNFLVTFNYVFPRTNNHKGNGVPTYLPLKGRELWEWAYHIQKHLAQQ